MQKAMLMYDNPEKNADLYYATGFMAPDSFIFFEIGGKKYLVMSDLEIDRARKNAKVNEVLSINKYMERVSKVNPSYAISDIICEVLSDFGVNTVVVPENASFVLVDALRKRGMTVEAGSSPFYTDRFQKTAAERKMILDAQKVVFGAMKLARDTLKKSKIKGNKLIYRNKSLTSESLRIAINMYLLEKGYIAPETIVSCGEHAIDPHDMGSGPLRPNDSIIIDIFPRSTKTYYCGDATRTFCKGKASDALKKLYATVKQGQELGISMIKPGVNGKAVHEAIHAFFKSKGYETGEKDGRRQGFFHGTGHSIGLEVHEEPARINFKDCALKEGFIMSVEPGLYYPGIGGVRIEDLICVTSKGCEVLAGFPKQLEL